MICDFGCSNIAIIKFKSGRYCCSKSTSSCPAMKLQNSNKHITELSVDWIEMQSKYDEGFSLGEIGKIFSIERGMLRGAINRGVLSVRNHKDSTKLAKKQGKGSLTDKGRKSLQDSARSRILERYEKGWMPKAGRCKKYRHDSPIAGVVWLDGTWELKVAQYLDNHKYTWKRNTIRFEYINLKGRLSHYTPDFFIEEIGGYLEIKGYETKLDRCKWSQFKEPLTVWKRKDLKELGVIP
jgi:predicted DNA-binding protein YlxM (UPF0122 family)